MKFSEQLRGFSVRKAALKELGNTQRHTGI